MVARKRRCRFCGLAVFQANFPTHLEQHFGSFLCALCDDTTNHRTKTRLLAHFAARHGLGVKCPVCSKVFSAREIRRHALVHQPKSPFTCDICGLSTLYKTALRRHMNLHLKVPDRSFLCQLCGGVCYSNSSFQMHKRVCNETTSRKKRPKYSILGDHQSPKDPPFRCPVCGVLFDTYRRLYRHLNYKHPPTPPNAAQLSCAICRKTFTHRLYLQAHENTHRKRKFACEICGAKFTHGFSVRKHINVVHLRDQHFACHTCHKVFFHADNLKRHLGVHTRPFRCTFPHCSKSFAVAIGLARHQKRHEDRLQRRQRVEINAKNGAF